MSWTVDYAPLAGSYEASAAIVVIPILSLFVLLFLTKVYIAAVVALSGCLIVAIALFKMPAGMAFLSALNGMLFAIWPVCLILFAAIALYDLTVITGHFETVRYTVASVSKDKRILALILAYCFSSFVEGATGFSTPVALAGALLVGVGVPPLQAAAAALMGNTVAVTFGGVGIAVTTLGSVTRLDPEILGVAITRLIIPITIIMPFMVVSCVTDSWWEVLAVWPACLLAGVTHICGMLVIAQYLGVQTVSILGGLFSLACTVIFVKFIWHPRRIIMTESMAAAEAALAQVTAADAAGALLVDKAAAPSAGGEAGKAVTPLTIGAAGAPAAAAAAAAAPAAGALVAGATDAAGEAEAEPLTPVPSTEVVARARAQSDAVAKQLSRRLPSSSALPVELARVQSWRPTSKSTAGADASAAGIGAEADDTTAGAAGQDGGADLGGVASAAAASGPPPVVLSIRAPDAPTGAMAGATRSAVADAAVGDIATPLASHLASQGAVTASGGAGTPSVKVVLRHKPRPGPATADSRLAARGRSRGQSAVSAGGGTPRVPGGGGGGPASTGAGSPAVFGGAAAAPQAAAEGTDNASTAGAAAGSTAPGDADARPITKGTLLLRRVPVTPQGRARIDSLASHTAAALVPGTEDDATPAQANGTASSADAGAGSGAPGGLAAFFRRITGRHASSSRAGAGAAAGAGGAATGLELPSQGRGRGGSSHDAPPVRPHAGAEQGEHHDDGEGTPLATAVAPAAVGVHVDSAGAAAAAAAAASAPARTTPISHKSSSSAEPPVLDAEADADANADVVDEHGAAAGAAKGKGGKGKVKEESHGDAHAKEAGGPKPEVEVHYDALHPPTRNEFIVAWAPWAIVCVAVVIWGLPGVKVGLSKATVLVPLNGLNNEVIKPDPARPDHPHKVAAVWTLDFLAATGICLIFCDLISSAIFRLHPFKTARIMWSSFRRMAFSFLSILLLIAFGYVIKMSGQDTTLGLTIAESKKAYPFIGPMVGFLGVALTGSITTSNVLFGSLQTVAADRIGLNPVQMAAANTAAGALGHIISTASMVVASVACGLVGGTITPIYKRVILYALVLIVLFGAWNCLVAYAFPDFIPTAPYLN